MRHPPFLNDPTRILVVDASAVISITASAHALQIVSAIPNHLIVPDIVVSELESGSQKGYANAEQLRDLIKDGKLDVVTMGEGASNIKQIHGPALSDRRFGQQGARKLDSRLSGLTAVF